MQVQSPIFCAQFLNISNYRSLASYVRMQEQLYREWVSQISKLYELGCSSDGRQSLMSNSFSSCPIGNEGYKLWTEHNTKLYELNEPFIRSQLQHNQTHLVSLRQDTSSSNLALDLIQMSEGLARLAQQLNHKIDSVEAENARYKCFEEELSCYSPLDMDFYLADTWSNKLKQVLKLPPLHQGKSTEEVNSQIENISSNLSSEIKLCRKKILQFKNELIAKYSQNVAIITQYLYELLTLGTELIKDIHQKLAKTSYIKSQTEEQYEGCPLTKNMVYIEELEKLLMLYDTGRSQFASGGLHKRLSQFLAMDSCGDVEQDFRVCIGCFDKFLQMRKRICFKIRGLLEILRRPVPQPDLPLGVQKVKTGLVSKIGDFIRNLIGIEGSSPSSPSDEAQAHATHNEDSYKLLNNFIWFILQEYARLKEQVCNGLALLESKRKASRELSKQGPRQEQMNILGPCVCSSQLENTHNSWEIPTSLNKRIKLAKIWPDKTISWVYGEILKGSTESNCPKDMLNSQVNLLRSLTAQNDPIYRSKCCVEVNPQVREKRTQVQSPKQQHILELYENRFVIKAKRTYIVPLDRIRRCTLGTNSLKIYIEAKNRIRCSNFSETQYNQLRDSLQEIHIQSDSTGNCKVKEPSQSISLVSPCQLSEQEIEAMGSRSQQIRDKLQKVSDFSKYWEDCIKLCSIRDFYDVIFTDSHSFLIDPDLPSFFARVALINGDKDFKITKYDKKGPYYFTRDPSITFLNSPLFSERQSSMRHSLPRIPFMPSECQCHETDKLYWVSDKELHYLAEVRLSGAAMLEMVVTSTLYVVKQIDQTDLSVEIYGQIRFLGNPTMKMALKKGGESDMRKLLPKIGQEMLISINIYYEKCLNKQQNSHAPIMPDQSDLSDISTDREEI